MVSRILIANRGEIACRVIRTARAMGIETVAVFSEADRAALHVEMADHAWPLPGVSPAESYLNQAAILRGVAALGADAVHPGYGFLSENAAFAQAVADAGAVFIGPPPEAIRAMGLKDAAKARMAAAGVPIVPGDLGEDQSPKHLAAAAQAIGYPVLIKARAGGGGKGMRKVDQPAAFAAALESCRREAEAAFGDPHCLIEKWITTPRHIEVQVFGDTHGTVVHLHERDCTLQRRHQKVIEEAPAPGMTPQMRAAMGAAAVAAAKAVGYHGAGTVEFIVDATDGLSPDRFYFMEMNTRLQVEHPVTEAITGQDLVAWQIRIARGEALPLRQEQIPLDGWAMEARLYAEDPTTGFLPSTGPLAHLRLPSTCRVDTGVREGDEVTSHYDPMIAKLIAHGPDREAARTTLRRALAQTRAVGVATNAGFLGALLDHDAVRDPMGPGAQFDTSLIGRAPDLAAAPPVSAAPIHAAALIASGLLHAGAGWHLWTPLRTPVCLRLGEETHQLWVSLRAPTQFLVEGDISQGATDTAAHQIEVTRHAPGHLSLTHGAGGLSVDYVETPGLLTLWSQGQAFAFHRVDPLARDTDGGHAGDTVRAPMPGQVRTLTAVPGQAVAAGDVLATLEAMKMEHALTAPRAGTIAEVPVSQGDQVAAGAVLLILEPDDG